MERELLTADEIEEALREADGWTVSDAKLQRRYEFENFDQSLTFVNAIAAIANELDHHPDITFGWGYAEVATTTHDRGGITDFDLELARRIDAISQ
jgi:4a-hydroxytetrahydrobiopterin dehydratase